CSLLFSLYDSPILVIYTLSLHALFRSSNLLTVRLALPRARYDTDVKKYALFQELMRRLAAIPGVRSASAALSLPTKNPLYTNIMKVEGVQLTDQDYGLSRSEERRVGKECVCRW